MGKPEKENKLPLPKMKILDLIDTLELAQQELINRGYNGLVIDKIEQIVSSIRKRLKEIARWEYDCLIRDMKAQGDNWRYETGFGKWFEEVFLVDEAWEEIREEALTP